MPSFILLFMTFFFINSKPLWKHVFLTSSLYFNRSFAKSESNINKHMINILLDCTFEMTLNSKHGTEKLNTKKNKDTETRKTKTQCYLPKMSLV